MGRLTQHLTGLGLADGSLRAQPLTGSHSNPTFLLESGKRRMVLRKTPVKRLPPSTHALDREHRIMAALSATMVPVPEMLHFCSDLDVIGTPFLLMDHVRGRVFSDPSLPGMPPSARTAIYQEMARVLAVLHNVDPVHAGLADFSPAEPFFQSQVARWTQQYLDAAPAPVQAMTQLAQWLPEHLPQDGSRRLLHGDYRIDNLVFHPTEPRVISLVDWEFAAVGDPMADLAFHLLAWHIPSTVWHGMAESDLKSLGIPSAAGFARHYAQCRGIKEIRHLDAYLAYACFRVAAILQCIATREGRKGDTPHARSEALAGAVAPIAALGWRRAIRHGERAR